MDRPLVYAAEIVRSADFLTGMQSAMISDGMMLSTLLGSSATVVSGFQFVPSSPASLQFSIGQGSIVSPQVVEQTAYGSLLANSYALTKMGINLAPTTFTLSAPTTPGQSITYLVEVTFVEQDVDPVLLSFYNSANPSQPYSGPNNSATAQNTLRQQSASLSLKAGASGNTGSQQIPTADVGWWPLWLITVNYGQTTITSANVSMAPGAPYLPNVLSNVRIPVTGGTLNLYVSPTGNDGYLGTSALYPMATISGAIARAASAYDLANASLTVNLAPGTYAGFDVYGSQIPAPVHVVGSGSGQTTVTSSNSDTIDVTAAGVLYLSGVRLTNTSGNTGDYGGGATTIYCVNGGSVNIGADVNFGSNTNGAHLWANTGGTVGAVAVGTGAGRNYTISGGAEFHLLATAGGSISLVDSTVTITGNPHFSQVFANSNGLGWIGYWGNTFSGSATGTRYFCGTNGVIDTHGGGASYLPGSVSGSTGSGGQYV